MDIVIGSHFGPPRSAPLENQPAATQHSNRSIPLPDGEKTSSSISLKGRLKEIPQRCLEFFKDEEWMSFIVSFIGIATEALEYVKSLSFEAHEAEMFIPYLSMASSPFYLHHALQGAKERFQLMVTAAKVSRVADACFWFGRGMDRAGTALSNISKPFAGGLELAGLKLRHFAFGFVFTLVIPITLMVCGMIGTISKGWAFARTQKALKEFNALVDEQELDLGRLEEILNFLMGPKSEGIDQELDTKHFNENHFSNSQRQKAIQAQIKPLLASLEKVKPLMEAIGSSDGGLSTLDQALNLYEALIKESPESELKQAIIKYRDELIKQKQKILKEGRELIQSARSEIHRILCYHSLFLLMATLTLTAGALLLYGGGYVPVGYGLAMASGALSVLYVLFEKQVSKETFEKMERYLHELLDKKSVARVQ